MHKAIPIIILLFIACGGKGRDPWLSIPSDADAVVFIKPADAISGGLESIIENVPVISGFPDLIYSITGISFIDPERTKENGIDPKRGLAIYFYVDGKATVILPIRNPSLAEKRLALRLARLGFLEKEKEGEVRVFEHKRGFYAIIQADSDLVFISFSKFYDNKRITNQKGSFFPVGYHDIVEENGMRDAVIAGIVLNHALTKLLPKEMGGKYRNLILPLLGDLRFSIDLSGGVRVRVVLGQRGKALKELKTPASDKDGFPVTLSLMVSEPYVAEISKNIQLFCQSCEGLVDLLKSWKGWINAVVLIDGNPQVLGLDFLKVVMSMGIQNQDVGERLTSSLKDMSSNPVDLPNAKGFTTMLPKGIEVAVLLGQETINFALGKGSVSILEKLSEPMSPFRNLLLKPQGKSILTIKVSPQTFLRMPLGKIDFVKHALSSLEMIYLDVSTEGMMVIGDAGIKVRGFSDLEE